MLGYEYERMFDSTLKKVSPYLVLSPKDFRDGLADRMTGLFHFLREDHSEIPFIDLNKKINEMIDPEKRESWDSTIEIKIHDFNERLMSFDERLRNLNERVTKLEKAKKEKITEKTKELLPITEKRRELLPITEKELITPHIIPIETKMLSIDQKLELLKNHLKTNERITSIEVRGICGVSFYQARQLLKKLDKENFVRRMGNKKGTYYERI